MFIMVVNSVLLYACVNAEENGKILALLQKNRDLNVLLV